MIHADVKSSTYIMIKILNLKFNIPGVSKQKNIFAKGYVPNWSEDIFVIKKVKNIVPWTYVISDLRGNEIVGTFYGKELQKQMKKSLRV